MAPKSSIIYSPLKTTDYVEAKNVFHRAFAYSEWRSLVTAWRGRAAYGCYSARYRGALVGFSLVSKDNVIKYIAVDPGYQGFKIGSGLLTMVMGSMVDVRSIRLTTAGDERLLTWYGRYGFRATDLLYDEDDTYVGAYMICTQRCRSASKRT